MYHRQTTQEPRQDRARNGQDEGCRRQEGQEEVSGGGYGAAQGGLRKRGWGSCSLWIYACRHCSVHLKAHWGKKPISNPKVQLTLELAQETQYLLQPLQRPEYILFLELNNVSSSNEQEVVLSLMDLNSIRSPGTMSSLLHTE